MWSWMKEAMISHGTYSARLGQELHRQEITLLESSCAEVLKELTFVMCQQFGWV